MCFSASENDFLCDQHFTPDCYVFPGSKKLKEDAIPSVFVSSSTNESPKKQRKVPTERTAPFAKKPKLDVDAVVTNIRDPTQDEISSSPTKDDLKKQIEDKDVKIHELKRKVKSLQRAVQRDKQKVSKRDNIIEDLRQQNLVSSSVANVLEENFSGVSFNVLMNHFVNKDRKPQGHRHNDEAKKFAMTLHFYSPRACANRVKESYQ